MEKERRGKRKKEERRGEERTKKSMNQSLTVVWTTRTMMVAKAKTSNTPSVAMMKYKQTLLVAPSLLGTVSSFTFMADSCESFA